MWKWGGKPQSKCYMVRLGNLIFQGDPLFFIFLYFSLFMTIFFHLFHGWLSQPVHSAVQCVVCCSVAPFPRHWVRDGQRNGEEKEYLNKLQTSCREEITFLMQSFSSTGAVKSAMPIFSVFRLFSFFKCHQNAENSVLTLLVLTLLDRPEPCFGFTKSCFVRGLRNGRPGEMDQLLLCRTSGGRIKVISSASQSDLNSWIWCSRYSMLNVSMRLNHNPDIFIGFPSIKCWLP